MGYLFQAIKKILDESIPILCSAQSLSHEDACGCIRRQLAKMQQEYYRQDQDASIDYEDPLTRLGYIYRHTPFHSGLFYKAIKNSGLSKHFIDLINSGQSIKICAFGGGPGSELLGFSKFCADNITRIEADKLTIDFVNLDLTSQWGESLAHIRDISIASFEEISPDKTISISINSQHIDHTDLESYTNLPRLFRDCDLFVVMYTLSEVQSHIDNLGLVLKSISDFSNNKTKFVIIDRKQDELIDSASTLFENAGLTITHERASDNFNIGFDEDVIELSDYRPLLQNPRIKGKAFWLVAEKAP